MEQWDAYDGALNKISGKVLTKGEQIPAGLFHLVCDVLVRHTDGTILLMQREAAKSCGGLWEATAGGSALAGETPLACALRELREETGICASRLTETGSVTDADSHTIYVEFLCVTGWNKEEITLQPGETAAFRWVSREELLRMRKAGLVTKRMRQFMEERLN